MRSILYSILGSVVLVSCSKEGALLESRSAPTLDTPLSMQLDSTCMTAPNFITANGDGINDQFRLLHNEPLASFSLSIVNPNGTVVHTASDQQQQWGGYDAEFMDETGPIPYLYALQVSTMSGAAHSSSKVLYVIRGIYNECITAEVQPIGGDQFEPRRLCDFLYATNDFVCVD